MRLAIHNIAPNGGQGVSDADFADLKKRVHDLKASAAAFTPNRINEIVAAAIRPVAAELALAEKEMRVQGGMRINAANVRGAFRLPQGDAA